MSYPTVLTFAPYPVVPFLAPGISASPDPNNQRYFHIMMGGPGGTPYEGGLYRLELFLPEQYPMEPPKVRFLTKIFHPNIVRSASLKSEKSISLHQFDLYTSSYSILQPLIFRTSWDGYAWIYSRRIGVLLCKSEQYYFQFKLFLQPLSLTILWMLRWPIFLRRTEPHLKRKVRDSVLFSDIFSAP